MIRSLFVQVGALVFLAIPTMVQAHEGHGHAPEGNTLFHYLTEPLHLLQIAAAVAVLTVIAILARHASAKRTHPGI